jgi:hypothetical protein
MKRFRLSGYVMMGCAALGCAQAWAESSLSSAAPVIQVCGEKTNMTSAEQIQQLSAAKTPAELLQLFRKLHDNFLLLGPSFIEDANLIRLFGPGEVVLDKPSKWDVATRKKFISGDESRRGEIFQIDNANTPKLVSGGIYFGSPTPVLPSYTAEMIEQHLVPDVEGVDRFSPGFPMTNENINASARRPRATHPKGYLEYRQIKETPLCRSILYIRLHQNGTLWDIHLDQDMKQREQGK